jgi:hypothetical protein
MKAEDSLPRSQQPATGPYPEPDESSSHPHMLFISGSFRYYSPVIRQPVSSSSSLRDLIYSENSVIWT